MTHARALFLKIFIATIIALAPFAAWAQEDRFGLVYGAATGLSTRDIRATAAVLINAALGIMGMVFFLMMLLGGLRWMTAGGNDESVDIAKKTLGQAMVGVIVIFIAFAATRFVFSTLEQAT